MSRERASSSQDAPKVKLTRANLRGALWIVSYLNRYGWMFYPAMVAVLITSALSLAFPILMGRLIGESMSDQAILQHANATALILLVILTVQAAITFARMQLLNRAGERALADMRLDTYARLVRLPMAFFSERRVGEISSRTASDLTLIQDTLVSTIPQFLRQCVMLSAGLVYLFILSPKLALFMLACLPAVLLFIAFFGFRIRGSSREAQDHLAETNVIIDETLHGIASVKSFGNEELETQRYRRSLDRYLAAAYQLIQGRAFMVAFVIFALFGAITLVVWFGARMLVAGDLPRPAFTQFCLVTAFVAGAFAALPEIISQIQKAVGATDRLRAILHEPCETGPSPATAAPSAPAAGQVSFEEVTFSYPSRPGASVLKGVSFHVESGQRVALVGPSGAGKSTTVSLLLRFFDASSGVIRLDGQDIRQYPLSWLRQQMAVVPQDVLLFGGSIRENIAYGKPGASEEEIRNAAIRAHAHDFISRLPEGYDTMAGERGTKLSGGQRQRIAIARAILANPSVLLLDEATSSLDAESERHVQDALEDLMRDRTSIIIAHRLATVRTANRIFVVNEGRIVQQGTHAELMEDHEGLYRMLAKLQFS